MLMMLMLLSLTLLLLLLLLLMLKKMLRRWHSASTSDIHGRYFSNGELNMPHLLGRNCIRPRGIRSS